MTTNQNQQQQNQPESIFVELTLAELMLKVNSREKAIEFATGIG
jgi:hypothetical protein